MSLHVYSFLLTLFLILSLVLLWCFCRLNLQPSHSPAGKRRPLVHRLLKPRTPLDCPICRLNSSSGGPTSAPVRPWPEVKSRRGAPKRIALNRSRPFAARPVIQLLLPGTIPLSTV